MRKVVVNTTPLIALSHVGQLEVLKDLYGEIIIPDAVYREDDYRCFHWMQNVWGLTFFAPHSVVSFDSKCDSLAYKFHYSITRISAKPVISKTSMTSSHTLVSFIAPFVFF